MVGVAGWGAGGIPRDLTYACVLKFAPHRIKSHQGKLKLFSESTCEPICDVARPTPSAKLSRASFGQTPMDLTSNSAGPRWAMPLAPHPVDHVREDWEDRIRIVRGRSSPLALGIDHQWAALSSMVQRHADIRVQLQTASRFLREEVQSNEGVQRGRNLQRVLNFCCHVRSSCGHPAQTTKACKRAAGGRHLSAGSLRDSLRWEKPRVPGKPHRLPSVQLVNSVLYVLSMKAFCLLANSTWWRCTCVL